MAWVHTSIYKNFTRRSRAIFSAFCSVSDAGNSVTSLPSTVPPDPHVPIKQDDSGTVPSKGTSSTVFVCDVAAVRSPYLRVLHMVNLSVKVSTKSSSRGEHDPRLRREQDVLLELSEYWVHTGSVRTPPTCTTKSSWLIPCTKPSVAIHASAGS